MTLDQFARSMAEEFGENYNDLDVADQFKAWAQESIDRVFTVARWFFKNAVEPISFSDGVATYTLSPSASEIRDMQITGGAGMVGLESQIGDRIAYMPVERLIARGYDLTTTGVPVAWYYAGVGESSELKFSVYPVPFDTITVDVHTLIRPPAYSADDTIGLPNEYVTAMRDNMRALVYANDDNLAASEKAAAKFEMALELLNARFSGPSPGRSRLKIKRSKQVHQAPGSADGA